MGSAHAKYLMDGRVKRVQLTAAADPRIARLKVPAGVKPFAKVEDLLGSGLVDAGVAAHTNFRQVFTEIFQMRIARRQ